MQRDLDGLTARTFDVLVVGGGIYGLTIAYDCAQRGLSVALIERYDFGSGASFNHLRKETPVVIYRELQPVQDIMGRQADAGVVRASLDKKNAATAVLGQPRGNNRAGRTRTDDDFVKHFDTICIYWLAPEGATVHSAAKQDYAAAMARPHNALLHLLHVEEGATSRLFGSIASTAEVNAGEEYFHGIVESLAQQGIRSELTVVHGEKPKDEIVQLAHLLEPDLIVMGAHGHRGVKDLIFGNTINGVRHEVSAPVLVVGDEPAYPNSYR